MYCVPYPYLDPGHSEYLGFDAWATGDVPHFAMLSYSKGSTPPSAHLTQARNTLFTSWPCMRVSGISKALRCQ